MAFAMSQMRGVGLSAKRSDARPGFVVASSNARAGLRTSAVQPATVLFPGQNSIRASRGALQVVASTASDMEGKAKREANKLEGKAQSMELSVEQDSRADWANLLAVAGFVGYWYNKVTVDRMLLLKALAVLQVFVAVTNLLTRVGTVDKVTTIIGPAVLGVFVLNFQVSFLDAATGLFGFYLAEQIEGPFWLWVATLAAALYYGYGTLWYTVAFAVVSAYKLFRSSKDEERLPLLSIPAVLVSAWAVYTERHFVWALLLYIGQAAWSGFTTVEKLAHKLDS